MRAAPSRPRWLFAAAMMVAGACAGTDTGNPIGDEGPGGGSTANAGDGSGTGAGAVGGGGAGVGGMPADGGPPGGLRRRCDDGRVPVLPDDALCDGCSGGWFCCSALEQAPFCAHESHPCFVMQLCAHGPDADGGVEPDADGGSG